MWQTSIFVMVSGAVIAGATDLSYSLPGYIWVAICAVSTAVYLLLIRKLSDKTGKPPFPHIPNLVASYSLALESDAVLVTI